MKSIISPGILKMALVASVFTGTFVIASCDKSDNDEMNQFTVSGNASGSQMSPAVATTATATLSGTYNANNNLLYYTIDWTGLTGAATMVRMYGPASVGANAGLIGDLSITTAGINGRASGNVVLADTTEAYLLAGRLYYVIHTATNVNGEIRGQVSATSP